MWKLADIIEHLRTTRQWSYRPGGPQGAEPAAITALALLSHGCADGARPALDFLRTIQRPSGAVPVSAGQRVPVWTTGWTLMAWAVACRGLTDGGERYRSSAARAARYLLSQRGTAGPREARLVQHNTALIGWPWVPETYSWVEPTSLAILGLAAVGYANHPRVREGVSLLVDRQLPCGGWNYGNTVVLGTTLRPHWLPSGLATAALACDPAYRKQYRTQIERACQFLRNGLDGPHSPISLSWCWLALAAHGAANDEEFSSRWQALVSRQPACPWGTYHWALLAWAASGTANPLWALLAEQPAKDVSSSVPRSKLTDDSPTPSELRTGAADGSVQRKPAAQY